ncbi:MAG TPA: CinA family protein [Chloroflexota bacterium]|nr:CinA family protein [Chloroflexota bacterium]
MTAALAQEIAALLIERGETVAVAESAAGGQISGALTAVPGASAWFLGAVVPYATLAKSRWLGLRAEELAGAGVVSQPAAQRMALAVREALGATWGLSETGIAGPQTGRRSSKPPGLVYVAVDGPVSEARLHTTGLPERGENQAAFTALALTLLLESLRRAPRTPLGPASHSSPTRG